MMVLWFKLFYYESTRSHDVTCKESAWSILCLLHNCVMNITSYLELNSVIELTKNSAENQPIASSFLISVQCSYSQIVFWGRERRDAASSPDLLKVC